MEIGGPLHQPQDPSEPRVLGDPEKHVLMAVAGAMGHALRMDFVERGGEFADLLGAKDPADNGKAMLAISRDMIVRKVRCEGKQAGAAPRQMLEPTSLAGFPSRARALSRGSLEEGPPTQDTGLARNSPWMASPVGPPP